MNLFVPKMRFQHSINCITAIRSSHFSLTKPIYPNMNETVTISRAEYEKLKGLESKVDELSRMNEWFLEQIKLLNKSKYSSKTDSVSEETALRKFLCKKESKQIRKQITNFVVKT